MISGNVRDNSIGTSPLSKFLKVKFWTVCTYIHTILLWYLENTVCIKGNFKSNSPAVRGERIGQFCLIQRPLLHTILYDIIAHHASNSEVEVSSHR